MTEIERIKKIIESAVTVFVGQDENEQGLVIPKQSLFHLITTIESQTKYISTFDNIRKIAESKIESQKEEIENFRDLVLTSNKMYTEISLRESDLNDEIESLKAITELILEWAKNDISIWSKVGQHVGTPKFTSLHVAKDIKNMIERLTHEQT